MNRFLLILASGLLITAACDRTRSSTGWDYAPDMYYSEAYESYAPSEIFENGLTLREPVEGTIPRDQIPFPYENTEEDRLAAGRELINPVESTQAAVSRGKKAYDIFCLACHGEQGDGQGFLFTSKRYPYPPASLVNEKVTGLSDGEIYHAITVGYGVMGAHGAMITQDDRWKIVHYIREELQK